MQRGNERFVERLPLVLHRSWYSYLLTAAFCGAALALRYGAEPLLPSGYPFVTFFPAVILASFLFGIRPGIFAAILCGALSWYCFIPPYGSLAMNPAVAVAMIFYMMVVCIDILLIHYMQRANFHLAVERERNRTLADNRALLFSELQHRVSNNLQVVAAMLALQRRHVDHDDARRALDDASSRVALVGRISRALYDPSGAGQDIAIFLKSLTHDVVEASGRTDVTVKVSAPDGVVIESDIVVPLALVVAEAVSNAIEHGLPDCAGTIAVTLKQDAGALILRVIDDGCGLAPGFRLGESGSLGLRIASALAGQLGGSFSLSPGAEQGAVASLHLPARTAC
ncbi:sensor histidine kinase [Sphingobium sp.]|uniref:sensor histidine kinase n=1 Tax=Sphingobium sp. TaxID=1912891 RepID=UPI003BB6BAA4